MEGRSSAAAATASSSTDLYPQDDPTYSGMIKGAGRPFSSADTVL